MTDPAPAPTETTPTETPVAETTTTDQPVETPPKRRRLGLRIALIVAGAFVLLAGGLATTYAVIASQHSPERMATDFLQHLVDGDAQDAVALVAKVPTGNPVMLNDEAYAAATDRISAFEILGTTVDGPRATVTALITQGDAEYEQDFTLSRVAYDFVFDRWRIDGGQLPSFEIAFTRPEGVSLTVNGADVGVFVDRFEGQVPALPGTYSFAGTGTTDYYTVETVTESVTFESTEPVNASLAVSLTEAGVASAYAAFSAHLGGCTSQATLTPPPACGFSFTSDGPNYTNIRWTLTAAPLVSFGDWRSDTFTQGGWFLVTDAPGSLRVDADFSDAVSYGTGSGTVNDYTPRGFITGFDDAGVATYESSYTG